MQSCFTRVLNMLAGLVLPCQSPKPLCDLFTSPAPQRLSKAKTGGQIMPRVRRYCYLGVTVDSRLCWRPQVNDFITRCTCAIAIVGPVRGLRWGALASSLLSVHRGLFLSPLLYVAPFIPPTPSLWLDRVPRAGLRVALSFPAFSRINATLSKAQDIPLAVHVHSDICFTSIAFLSLQCFICIH